MKKQYLFCILMIVLMLMLCGCTAAVSDAAPEGAEPGLPAESTPAQSDPAVSTGSASTPQMGTDLWTDYGVGDRPDAPEETQYGRALRGEELQALWARLEGKWILSDPEAWKYSDGFVYPVYDFSVMANGGCRLLEYSALGSGASDWDLTVAREQNGVYKIRVASEGGEMTQYICHQNSGTLFTLEFTENGMLLARSRPTRFEYWETQPTEGMNGIIGTRPASEEECERLANEGDEYGCLRLENNCALIAGYEQPAQAYRLVTDEELERLVQENG